MSKKERDTQAETEIERERWQVKETSSRDILTKKEWRKIHEAGQTEKGRRKLMNEHNKPW